MWFRPDTTTQPGFALLVTQPVLVATPTRASPETLHIACLGFSPDESVTVQLAANSTVTTTATTNANGDLTTTLTVPETDEGTFTLTATGATSGITLSKNISVN